MRRSTEGWRLVPVRITGPGSSPPTTRDAAVRRRKALVRAGSLKEEIMGIFGDDKLQDKRIAALEDHIRTLTETVQTVQADLAQGHIAILALQAQVDEKVSSADVDPAIIELNQDLAKARAELDKASAAASEGWAELQDGVRDSFETLRTSVQKAYERVKES
jgi:hypothetical protein